MNDAEARRQLAGISRELFAAGLVTALGGNVSVRSPERPDSIWISPSGVWKGGLTAAMMVRIDMAGGRLEGDRRPSVESVYHGGVMSRRPEVGAVVHTHAPLATVLSMCGVEILPVTSEAAMLMDYPTIDFHPGGSPQLQAAVVAALGVPGVPGAFLRNHGLVTVGRDLREAADRTHMVEHTARILLTARMLGLTPSLLPATAVRALRGAALSAHA